MPPRFSLFSRLNLPTSFKGLVTFGTLTGSYFTLRRGTNFSQINFSDWGKLPIGRFNPDMTSRSGYDPASTKFTVPRDQENLASNPPGSIGVDGHVYYFTSKTFSIPPEALASLIAAGSAAAVPMILSFAAGDAYLVRPDSEMAKYTSDFEYTKAVFASGNFPADSLVALGESRVRMSDVVVSAKDGGFAISLRATTTEQHLFNGSVRWELQVDKDGSARTNISGTGKAPFVGIDVVNNCLAGPLWGVHAEKLEALLGAMAKDKELLARSQDLAELRQNVRVHSELPRLTRFQEVLLEVMNSASGPAVFLRSVMFAADPQPLKDSTSKDINAGVNQPQEPSKGDIIGPEQQSALRQSVESTQATDDPVLNNKDLEKYVRPGGSNPGQKDETDAERRAREEQEKEREGEAAAREREREKEREQREREEREHNGH